MKAVKRLLLGAVLASCVTAAGAVKPGVEEARHLLAHGDAGSFADKAARQSPNLPDAALDHVPGHASAWDVANVPEHAGAHDGTDLVAAPVPEPHTYALMLAGLGLVAVSRWVAQRALRARRRRLLKADDGDDA